MTPAPYSRLAVFGLVLALLPGCAELQSAGDKLYGWMRNYSLGRYRSSPQQRAVAHQRASRHYERLPVARKKQMREKKQRYLAVRTLDPTGAQLAEIKKKAAQPGYSGGGGYGGVRRGAKPPPSTPASAQGPYHCVIVWDTWAKEVVGNDCYAVTQLPTVGETVRLDTYSAEYIGVGEG